MSTSAQGLAFQQLRGATEAIDFASKVDAERVVKHLISCERHRGCHHIAIFHEGRAVLMSPDGLDCLKKAGLLE